jgi:hypothetical protein
MITFLFVLKCLFLFVGILFSIANIERTILQSEIPVANNIWQAIGITGFIILQWLI